MPITEKYPFRADIRAKLIETASVGQTVTYMQLQTSRAMIGRYLHRIALEEAKAGRPQLTAVAVRAGDGSPGDGFREALVAARYIDQSDSRTINEIWKAALKEVHEYWRPKLGDLLEGSE